MGPDEKSQKLGELLVMLRDSFQSSSEAIDTFLNYLGKPLDPNRSEVYEKLNWENRTSDKGPFQMLHKDNCNNTQLFNHLEAILRQNKNNITIDNYHYWTGAKLHLQTQKEKPT